LAADEIPVYSFGGCVSGGLLFELRYRMEAYDKDTRGRFIRNSEKDASLPDIPPQFQNARGSYDKVAVHAVRLNEIQRRAGFLHYLFFPEVVDTAGAR
jgi:hypothetical protein